MGNRNLSEWTTRLVVLDAAVVLFVVLGCEDKALNPRPPEDYIAYFGQAEHNGGNWYFGYRPATNTIDSCWLPYADPPVISANGKYMYVRDRTLGGVAVLELDSFKTVDHLPYYEPIAASADGRYLALFGDGIRILSTRDYATVYATDTSFHTGAFSASSRRFYAAGNHLVRRIDLSRRVGAEKSYAFPQGSVWQVQPSPDEAKLFVYLTVHSESSIFGVYQVSRNSLIFADTLTPGGGALQVTPDGSFVFYTNAGTGFSSVGSPLLYTYRVRENRGDNPISTIGVLPAPYESGAPLGRMCITPDGRWLVILGMGYPWMFAVDVRQKAISEYLRLDFPFHRGPSCQSGF